MDELMSAQVMASEKRAIEKRARAEEEGLPQWQEAASSPLSAEEGYDDFDDGDGNEMVEDDDEEEGLDAIQDATADAEDP